MKCLCGYNFASQVWVKLSLLFFCKNSFLVSGVVSRFLIVIAVSGLVLRAEAQSNSWTNATSGNWQDSGWSLGVLPGTNQTIFLTNAGWKAVQISSSTVQTSPGSMSVDSIVISSPTNSYNTLQLNYAGSAVPLTVKTLSIGSNSAVTMSSSALQINGSAGSNNVGMTIGGEFDQNDSVVAANQISLGDTGPGVYNFNGGWLTASSLEVGGQFGGIFNQNGGTNGFGTTDLEGGTYVLSGGYFRAAIHFGASGQFTQSGGILNTDLTIAAGNYSLFGGIHQGDAAVPSPDGTSSGFGGMLQCGGTNYGSLTIGNYGYGSYILSNGVSVASNLVVGYAGTYDQWGGAQEVSGAVTVSEQQIAMATYSVGFLNLHGGEMFSPEMSLSGHYTQDGGTNLVSGDVTMQGTHGMLTIDGGFLTADNINANPGFVGGIFLNGGTLAVSGKLWIGGNSELPEWQGFVGGAGELIASNIWVAPQASFSCGNSAVVQSGTLTLANAALYAGGNSVQFGPLQLATGSSTNSTLYFPSGASIVRFADSSAVTWSNGVSLVIEDWSGSLYGGGRQQIVFGTNAAALTAVQVGQIQFQNPAGLAAGTYPAEILPDGEVVPNFGGALPVSMALARQPAGMQLTLQGEPGRTYTIETSTDMVHWVSWTKEVNTNGTMCVTDTDCNCPMRFYRAKLEP